MEKSDYVCLKYNTFIIKLGKNNILGKQKTHLVSGYL